jgi:hypothetical protein
MPVTYRAEPGDAVWTTVGDLLAQDDEQVTSLDLLHTADRKPLHSAGDGGGDGGLHLHRLDGRDRPPAHGSPTMRS